MGNRRIGLGRLEALMENANFAATLTLDDSDVTVNSLTSDGAIVATTGGVTATAGGLTATAGGLTITAGPVKGVVGVVYGNSGVVTSGATFNSGAMTVPAGSVIIDMGCVVTTTVAAGNGVFGVRFGTTANAVDLAALDEDGLEASGTAVAVGIGTAMDAVLQTALGGTAVVIMDAGDAWRAAETAVHGSVLSAGGSITGGAISFWTKYITVI